MKQTNREITGTAYRTLFHALAFSAEKHKNQRRKGQEHYPYINHPIRVGRYLSECCDGIDVVVLIAAVLHDTIEDTNTNPQEIEALFGRDVLGMVIEVTDDKDLPREVRQRLQIETVSGNSCGAKLIRIADKIDNVTELVHSPPAGWSDERKREYLQWAQEVVGRLEGTNACLERMFEERVRQAERLLFSEGGAGT
jgi:guanosine-3',5'-bis(diphosphate) 3'-pyrophosphohydrolase